MGAGNGTAGQRLKGWKVKENSWSPQRVLVPTSQSDVEVWAVWWGSWPPLEPRSSLLNSYI